MQLLIVFLFAVTAVALFSASAVTAFRMMTKSDKYGRLHVGSIWAGVVFFTLLVAAVWFNGGAQSLEGGFVLTLISWAFVVAAALLVALHKGSYAEYMPPAALLGLLIGWGLGSGFVIPGQEDVYVGGPFLVLHVAFYMVSAAFFLVGGIASALAMIQQKNLKEVNLGEANRLPSLSALKRTGRLCIATGMPIYTTGLILGILRAVNLVDLWFISPRVLLAFALWLVVLLYLFEVYVVKAPTLTISRTGIAVAIMTLVLAVMSAAIPMFLTGTLS